MNMLKIITSVWGIKILQILISFILPAIIVRSYDSDSFGLYVFLLSLLSYAGIFQSGITASFRHELSNANNYKSIKLYQNAYSKSLYILVIVAILMIFIGLALNKLEMLLFLSISMLSILSPVTSTYFDYKHQSVRYRIFELVSILVTVVLTLILIFFESNIYVVASLWSLNRLFSSMYYAPYKSYKIFVNSMKSNVSTKVFEIVDKRDVNCLLAQCSSVVLMIVFNFTLVKLLGYQNYGELNLYQRFIFFPLQLFSSIAPILWMSYSKDSQNSNHIDFLLVITVITWSMLIYYISPFIVEVYSGKYIEPSYLIFMVFLYLTMQVKDIFSVVMNVQGNFNLQSVLNTITLLVVIATYYLTMKVEFVISAASLCYLITSCIYFKGRKNESNS